MEPVTIVVAGATGSLGERVVRALLGRHARVRALLRPATPVTVRKRLHNLGVELAEADYREPSELAAACRDAACVVSTLAGLYDVGVDAQSALLTAAIAASVPRFIPSDFSGDFNQQPLGENRNFDLHQEFRARLREIATGRIETTSILNGMFAELLTGKAPIILFKLRRVLYWGNPDQRMDFTTMDDVAAFTSAAALDSTTPETLRIAGDQLSARELAAVVSELTGQPFRLWRGGSLDTLGKLSRLARSVYPAEGAVFPPWQGMQYLKSMFSGQAKLDPLDNDRYPIAWTQVRDVLAPAARVGAQPSAAE